MAKLAYFSPLALWAGACVSVDTVQPEQQAAVQGYSCEVLEQKLAQYGVLRDKSASSQNATSGQNVAGTVASNVLTLGLASQAVALSNVKNAEANEAKYKKVLEVYYLEWDRKKCSEWLYERNHKSR